MAIGFLSLLLRDDHPLPAPAVRFFVQSLNHDGLVVRKVDGLVSYFWHYFVYHVSVLLTSFCIFVML